MTRGDPADPTTLHQSHLCAAAFTICTDSQSLLKAIERRSPVTHYLRSLLNARPGPTSPVTLLGPPPMPPRDPSSAGAYRSITDKFEDSGGVWRVLLVQGLHGH